MNKRNSSAGTTDEQRTTADSLPSASLEQNGMLGEGTKRALKILLETTWQNPMSASRFALLMWPTSSMHTKSSNQGNGACRGKAAWLSAGSFLSKLIKKGLVYRSLDAYKNGYYISSNGREAAKDFA